MNKWIAVVLAAVLILTCAACDNDRTQTDPTQDDSTTYEGVSVEVLYVEVTEEDTVLHVQWKNDTEYPIVYGEGFSLQRFEQGNWVDCPMNENTAFISIGYQLEAGKQLTKPYALNWAFGQLPEGHYRFATSCSVLVTGENEACNLSAEFGIGCDPNQKDSMKGEYEEPPKLMINDLGEAITGTYQWSCAMGDGTWSHVCADSAHPLQMEENLVALSPGNAWVDLNFEVYPDDYVIRCWPDSEFGNTDAKSQALMTWNNSVQLKKGGYVYEVTATWNDHGTGYYGTVTYVFYAAPAVPYSYLEPYDVMPISVGAKLYVAGEVVSLGGVQSKIVIDILNSLAYDQNDICNCEPEYNLTLPNGGEYGIHLEEGYVRCDKGQSKLNDQQLEVLSSIIDWALERTKAR